MRIDLGQSRINTKSRNCLIRNVRVYVLCRIQSGKQSGYVPYMNHQRNGQTHLKPVGVPPEQLHEGLQCSVFHELEQQPMLTGVKSREEATHVLQKGDAYQFVRNCCTYINDPVGVQLLKDLGIYDHVTRQWLLLCGCAGH
jgi:hypothetical protein